MVEHSKKMEEIQDDDQLTDAEFQKKYAEIFFKTTGKKYGENKSKIQLVAGNAKDGRFTTHLSHAGMFRHQGLNTICDKERWITGSKDWMEHLN